MSQRDSKRNYLEKKMALDCSFKTKMITMRDRNTADMPFLIVFSLDDPNWDGRFVAINTYSGASVTIKHAHSAQLDDIKDLGDVDRFIFARVMVGELEHMSSTKPVSGTSKLAMPILADYFRLFLIDSNAHPLPDKIDLAPFREKLDKSYSAAKAAK